MNVAVLGLYDIVINGTDFLTDLPAYKDATDKSVANVVDIYIEAAGGVASGSTRMQLIERAWSEMERADEQRRVYNERDALKVKPEYCIYANAN